MTHSLVAICGISFCMHGLTLQPEVTGGRQFSFHNNIVENRFAYLNQLWDFSQEMASFLPEHLRENRGRANDYLVDWYKFFGCLHKIGVNKYVV